MSAMHTPGPWVVDSAPEGSHKVRHAGGYDHAVVALVPPADGWSLLHQDYNASLIAAAPELLEALGLIVAQVKAGGHIYASHLEAAEAAIAKAEGR